MDGLIFEGYQFSWFSWGSDPHFGEFWTPWMCHKNKVIHSILPGNWYSKIFATCIPALACGQLITPFQVCEFQCFKKENLTSAEYSSEAGLACRDYCLKHAYVCYVSLQEREKKTYAECSGEAVLACRDCCLKQARMYFTSYSWYWLNSFIFWSVHHITW